MSQPPAYSGYPPPMDVKQAGYGGPNAAGGYAVTTTKSTVVVQQPAMASPHMTPGDIATAERRRREMEQQRKFFGIVFGGFLCLPCLGCDRASVSITWTLTLTLITCMHGHL